MKPVDHSISVTDSLVHGTWSRTQNLWVCSR